MSNNNGITVLTANEFPIFEPNQVLTNKDLNAIGAYLEPRSRLTRSKLIGIGIVCGLEVSGDNTSVTVSPGVGVTSDGHLIFVEEPIVNTHYIDFIESANPAYPYLENLNNAVELLSDYVPTGAPTLDAAIISNKIAVLYLECTEEDRANCTNECEELGQVRKYSLRVLLVSQDDANEIAQHTVTCNETGIAYDGELNPSVSLEKLHLKKPQLLSGLNCDEDPPVDATVEPFTAQIIAQKYQGVINDAVNKIDTAFNELGGELPGYFEALGYQEDVLSGFASNNNAPTQDIGTQYFYDYLCDLADAYNELTDAVHELKAFCCPKRCFPKHLMLGVLNNKTPYRKQDFRQEFIPSPAQHEQAELRNKVFFLLDRLISMKSSFEFEVYPDITDIKVTLSKGSDSLLGERAIPCYYNIDSVATGEAEKALKEVWNFEKARAGITDEYQTFHYNGQTTGIASLYSSPLEYNLKDYDFFRIEGHLDCDYEIVVNRLNCLIKKHHLPFSVIALKSDLVDNDFEVFPTNRFADLEVIYEATKKRILCVLKDARDFVSDNIEYAPVVDSKRQVVVLRYTNHKAIINTAKSKAKDVRSQLNVLISYMENRKLKDFSATSFKNGLENVINHCYGFLEAIYQVSEFTNTNNPLQNLVVGRFDCIFSELEAQLKKRVTAENSKVLFPHFLVNNPEAVHSGGVFRGGTFVLVFESISNRRVIADFCLPYAYSSNCYRYQPKAIVNSNETGISSSPKVLTVNDWIIRLTNQYSSNELRENDENYFTYGLKDGVLSVESQVEDFTNTIKLDFNNFQTKANETLAGVSGVANITIAAHDAVAAHAGTGTAAARKADEANKKSDDKDALK